MLPLTGTTHLLRSVHEEARDQARVLVGTPDFDRSRNERKKVEMLFTAGCADQGLGRLRKLLYRRSSPDPEDGAYAYWWFRRAFLSA